jgi:hypothetical protein
MTIPLPNPPASNAPAQYVQLAFWIDRYIPGYVDAYDGPPEMKAQAIAGDRPPLSALDELADSLDQSLSSERGLVPDRRAFLEAELRAMRTTIQILGGQAPDFVDEVERLYGVTPAWVDERVFEDAHQALNDIVPGSEPLLARVQGFQDRSRVTVAVARTIIRQVLEDFRSRAARLFSLPPGEDCELAFVTDKPWFAYHWYLGEGQSRIEFNQDFPMQAWGLPFIVAHEAYPGHHTEFAIKEDHLYRRAGRLEHAILLSNTPSALVSEGLAQNALAALVSDGELAALLRACYAQAGLPPDDAARVPAFAAARRQLEGVTDNQLLLLYRDHAPETAVAAYGQRFALTTADDEARSLRFFKDPLARAYSYNYTLGRQLVATFLDGAPDRTRAFQHLLAEPWTPAQIRGLAQTPG